MDLGEDDLELETDDSGSPAWMATFSDMSILLLTFFILLLSFANMDLKNFRVALGSVKEALGAPTKVHGGQEAQNDSPVPPSTEPAAESLVEAARARERKVLQVKAFINKRGMTDKVDVSAGPRGVTIRMRNVMLFDVGDAVLKPGGEAVLNMVAEIFDVFDGRLAIEGHTDNKPIQSARFPSNWELSTARAMAVLRHVAPGGDERRQRMYVAGYADSRPVTANDTALGRQKNRRVEFVFEPLRHGKKSHFRLPLATEVPDAPEAPRSK